MDGDDEVCRQLSLEIWGEVYSRLTSPVYRNHIITEVLESKCSGKCSEEEATKRLKYRLEIEPIQKASRAAIRGTLQSWSTIRKIVFERDGGICQVCGIELDKRNYECGHMVDKVAGGSDRPSNLLAMCIKCNQLKPVHKTKREFYSWLENGGVFGALMEYLKVGGRRHGRG